MKNVTGILIDIVLNPYMSLGGMSILTILILPIHVHKIYFHLFFLSFSFNDQLILDKGSWGIQWGNNSLFNKYPVVPVQNCKRMELDLHLIPYRKNHSK